MVAFLGWICTERIFRTTYTLPGVQLGSEVSRQGRQGRLAAWYDLAASRGRVLVGAVTCSMVSLAPSDSDQICKHFNLPFSFSSADFVDHGIDSADPNCRFSEGLADENGREQWMLTAGRIYVGSGVHPVDLGCQICACWMLAVGQMCVKSHIAQMDRDENCGCYFA